MPVNKEAYHQLKAELNEKKVTLVVVSKTKPIEDILELYNLGHRDFGENYVQELCDKAALLPGDIRWHFIGHLQTNKIKHIAAFVQLIQGVDSLKLLTAINKEAIKAGRTVDCLLQVHISDEETKFGMNEEELILVLNMFNKEKMTNVKILGLMGMGSFTADKDKLKAEFRFLKSLYDKITISVQLNAPFTVLSMGMSNDYKLALEEGSTLVRIGSLLLGERSQ